MISTRRHYARVLCLTAGALMACADSPTQVIEAPAPQLSAVKFWNVTASTRWNRRVAEFLALRPPSNGQAATSRILTYLSLAQYRAVLAAEKANEGSAHPSVSAAVGGASVAVLSAFFPLDIATLEGYLVALLVWPVV